MTQETLTGAEQVIRALKDQGVDTIFGYPGGAVLPIYDALFEAHGIKHILVRHEQGAAHAAEGYARSTGKVGVVLVTSGPGATNAVTGLTDAMMDSIPVLCITGQVATHLIGNDAFQEADTTGITRPCTKHNYLVKRVDRLAPTLHDAFYVCQAGRPGPVVVDVPKDVQFASSAYVGPTGTRHKSYRPQLEPQRQRVEQAVDLIAQAKRPIFYTGGGVINAGPEASRLLAEFAHETGYPVTNTVMGLGAFPASDPQFLGMLGMHGTYEANLAMYHCDVMINIGARFDDRVTGNTQKFSPGSKKIHVDVDPSSINKNIAVDIPIIGDARRTLALMLEIWREKGYSVPAERLQPWWNQINEWRSINCLAYEQGETLIKPQHAIKRLYELTQGSEAITDKPVYITTEVGQHQMWAAQYFKFEAPNRWMTSGGLGTMGYGLPAAMGTQVAHPEGLVIDIAGEASLLMTMQELSTMRQYNLPVKVFIINNQWMGMVRQWQELLHGERYAESYSAALPNFVELAQAFGWKGLRANTPADLDGVIREMITTDGPVVADICVDQVENCYPMIPAGKGHHEMLLGREGDDTSESEEGKILV